MIKHQVLIFIAIGALALGSGWLLFPQVETTEFHPDEPGWISSGFYYTDLLLSHDWDRTKWDCSPCEGWGSLNPHLGKWLLGFPMEWLNTRRYFGFWNFDLGQEQNISNGKLPQQEVLFSARHVSVIYGIALVLGVFALGYLTANWAVGTLAAFLVLINSVFVIHTTRAMTDVPYNLFLLGGALTGLLLLRPVWRIRLWGAVLSGGMGAFAFSVKVTGILLVSAVFAVLIMYLFTLKQITIRQVIALLLVFGIIALTIIYLFNPLFWPAHVPIRWNDVGNQAAVAIGEFLQGRLHRGGLATRFPELDKLSQNLTQTADHLLEFPRLFLRWKENMDGMVRKLGADWAENRLLTFHSSLLGIYASFPFEWILR